MKNNETKQKQDQQSILAIFSVKNNQGVEARHQIKFIDVDSIREIYTKVIDFTKTISKEHPFQLITLTIVPKSITEVKK